MATLAQNAEKWIATVELTHDWAHAAGDGVIETENGPVRSPAKLIEDKANEIDAAAGVTRVFATRAALNDAASAGEFTAPRDLVVTADETHSGEKTKYFWNGASLDWVLLAKDVPALEDISAEATAAIAAAAAADASKGVAQGAETVAVDSAAAALAEATAALASKVAAEISETNAAASEETALKTLPHYGPTPPPDPLPNALWRNSTTGKLYTWIVEGVQGQWVDAGALVVLDDPSYAEQLRSQIAASGGADGVGIGLTYAVPYLKVTSKIIQGLPVTIDWFIPDSEVQNCRNGTSDFLVEGNLEDPLSRGVHLYVPRGVYMVSPSLTTAGVTNEYAANKVCLPIRSAVTIQGSGTFRLAPGAYGASVGAIFGTPDGDIEDVVIDGITVDGNRSAVTGAFNCINLVGAIRPHITRTVTRNAPATGAVGGINLALRSAAGARRPVDCMVIGNHSLNAGYIGAQFDRNMGGQVTNLLIDGTVDNGLDIFGNDGAGGEANAGQGKQFVVVGLVARNIGLSGVFLESVGDIILQAFNVQDFGNGAIFLNRINSAAHRVTIADGRIRNESGLGTGIVYKNTVGRGMISGVTFEKLEYSLDCRSSQYLHVGANYHSEISKELIHTPAAANNFWRGSIDRQVYLGSQNTTTLLPQLHSPNDNPINTPNRVSPYNVTGTGNIKMPLALSTGTEFPSSNYTRKTVNLQTFPSTSVYSQYTSGETQVYLSGANEPTLGDYALIAGVAWQFLARPSASVWQVRKWTGAAFVAGDYTAELNSALSVAVKAPAWMTE